MGLSVGPIEDQGDFTLENNNHISTSCYSVSEVTYMYCQRSQVNVVAQNDHDGKIYCIHHLWNLVLLLCILLLSSSSPLTFWQCSAYPFRILASGRLQPEPMSAGILTYTAWSVWLQSMVTWVHFDRILYQITAFFLIFESTFIQHIVMFYW